MKLVGIVILYHPDDNVVENNINTYIDFVEQLIVWENSPAQFNGDIPENEKIIKMGDGTNVGIGVALNEAVKYAQANGFTHLLTMDQDSHFEEGHFAKYVTMVANASEKTIFAPNYLIYGKLSFKIQETFLTVDGSLQSGTIYPVVIFDDIGLFREDLIVDGVDSEMNYRTKQFGILAQIITPILLHHPLGPPPKKYKFLGMAIAASCERPAQRSYYLVRNHLLLKKNHPEHDTALSYIFYKRLFLVVLFEKDKQAKLNALILGYIHGKMGKTGKYVLMA